MRTAVSSHFERQLANQIIALSPPALIIDLDNTLIWEEDYFSSAAAEIELVFQSLVGRVSARALREELQQGYHSGNKKNLFQTALEKTRIDESRIDLILKIFRHHKMPVKLELRPWFQEAIPLLSAKMGILTNGSPTVQENKIQNLRELSLLSEIDIVYANNLKAKPHPIGVFHLAKKWSIPVKDIVFVGDSLVDRICADSAGCQFIPAIPGIVAHN